MARGESPGLIQDIQLDGVRLELGRTTAWPMRRDLRPAATGGGPHDCIAPAVHIERAADVRLRDIDIHWQEGDLSDYGSALVARDTPGLVLDGVRGKAARPGLPDLDTDQVTAPAHLSDSTTSGEW